MGYDLIIPKGVYHRANGNLPPFELVNMLAEETPSVKGGVSLLSFPGLTTSTTVGTGPILGIYRKDDLFSGAKFVVSTDGHLYKDGSNLGTIDGSGPVWWASSDVELVVGRGAHAYSYNGTALAQISFPDSANVQWGTFLAGLFIFARAGSRKFYWSAVLDARTIDPVDFASAESSASYILQSLAIGDVLYHGCKDEIEAWYPTGDGTLPFLRITQRTAPRGIASAGSMIEYDNALHFIGNDHTVYRMQDVPTPISNAGIDEKITASTTFALWKYKLESHPILMVRIDNYSYGYDISTGGQWHERRTTLVSNWAAQCAIQQSDGSPMFGSATGNELLVHSGWAEGASELYREFTAAIPLTRSTPLDAVELDCNAGASTDLTINPVIMMRRSRDAGNTWSDWADTALGSAGVGGTGQYRVRAKWRRLGMFDAPGALLHFRVTDAVPFRVSGAIADESSAGRSRG
jgi:hypothetical protein